MTDVPETIFSYVICSVYRFHTACNLDKVLYIDCDIIFNVP